MHARILTGAFAFVLILSPFVAERAVPGDALYLVKTGFNETIQKQLANSPYEKIEFETKLMERRISEARSLAQEGKLTEEVKTQIAETVKEHSVAVQSGIAELKVADADGAAIAQIAFTTSLEVQSAVLDAEEDTVNSGLIDAVKIVVNEAREEAAVSKEGNKPSFEGLIAKVETETTRAYELFATVKESATPDEVADIERRLSDLNRLIGEAKIKQENPPMIATADTSADALFATTMVAPEEGAEMAKMAMPVAEEVVVDPGAEDLAHTLSLIQKLIHFMTDIDVREAVALDVLVPVVLSTEERTTIAREERERIGKIVEEITLRLPDIDDVGAEERLTTGIADVTALGDNALFALQDGNLDLAESLLRDARVLVDDLNILSQHEGIRSGGNGKKDNNKDTEENGTTTESVTPEL